MASLSVLAPVDPSTVQDVEHQKAAPWVVRKLVGVGVTLHNQFDSGTHCYILCVILKTVDNW